MVATAQRSSAQIVQFPTGGRAGLATRAAGLRQASEIPAQVANIAFGSWYHEEAVREDREEDRNRQN